VSSSFLLLVGFLVLLYFVMTLPNSRRARQQQELMTRLQPGVEVMTTAGLFGTVREVTDDEVRIEVAPGVVQRYAKGAIMRVVSPEETPAELEPGTDEPGGASSEDGSSDPPAAPTQT
jgi:preprotein translocase subunit YajC